MSHNSVAYCMLPWQHVPYKIAGGSSFVDLQPQTQENVEKWPGGEPDKCDVLHARTHYDIRHDWCRREVPPGDFLFYLNSASPFPCASALIPDCSHLFPIVLVCIYIARVSSCPDCFVPLSCHAAVVRFLLLPLEFSLLCNLIRKSQFTSVSSVSKASVFDDCL